MCGRADEITGFALRAIAAGVAGKEFVEWAVKERDLAFKEQEEASIAFQEAAMANMRRASSK